MNFPGLFFNPLLMKLLIKKNLLLSVVTHVFLVRLNISKDYTQNRFIHWLVDL